MTSPISGLDPTLSVGSLQDQAKKASNDLDKDAFMKLLVAQMKYQNPSAPTDGKEYLAQMAQFAMVEKLSALSQAQADALSWQKNLTGQAMIGQTVTGVGATGQSVSDEVVGLTVGTAGPLLELRNGGTLAVDKVTRVAPTPTAPTAPTAPGTSTAPGTPTTATAPRA